MNSRFLFGSFFPGGFEASTHRNAEGQAYAMARNWALISPAGRK
jgi:hypothetical protein